MGITFKNAPKPIKAFFHSFSQVVLVENIISGLLILIAFFVAGLEFNGWAFGDFASYNLGVAAILGCIIGNVTAKLIGCDDDAIAAGLFGFNPVLVACAAATFFTGPDVYIITIIGCILVEPVTIMINKLFGRLGLPGFTMPFIAMTWFFILISFTSGLLTSGAAGGASTLLQSGAGSVFAFDFEGLAAGGTLSPVATSMGWLDTLTKGIGEIYLLDSVFGSLIILLAFAWDRWHLAIKIALVIVATLLIGLAFGVSTANLNVGLYTYCSILVLMGMETFSTSKDKPARYWLLVAFGVVFACLFQYAIGPVLGVFALPALTFPFCVATWATLYFEQQQFGSN